MLGAIIGDICGSYYEHNAVDKYNFDLIRDISNFTDDSVLTVATANAILTNTSYSTNYKNFAQIHINRGYGYRFLEWIFEGNEPYNSFGNGSAMRVSPIGYLYDNIEETLLEAKNSAECTHNHPEGIKGAQAIALAIYLARTNHSKETIKNEIENRFNYDLNRTIDEIQPTYGFDVTCQGSVPEAIISFLESTDYESSIRNAIWLGGDSDTLACMSGSIAEAYYKEIPKYLAEKALSVLPIDFIEIINKFNKKYSVYIHFIK